MMAEMYLIDRKPLLPLWLTAIVIFSLFIAVFMVKSITPLLLITPSLIIVNYLFYKSHFIAIFKKVILVVVIISLLSFKPHIIPLVFLKALSYISLSTLFFALYPPRYAIKHKFSHITFSLLPYLEYVTSNILLSAKIKGVRISSYNPITRIKSYIKILIPTFTIFMKLVDDVSLSIKIKGGDR